MPEEKKDVVVPSSGADEPKKPVDGGEGSGDDKLINLAALRKKLDATSAENASLKKALEESKGAVDRTLLTEEEKKPKKDDTVKVLFERDVKEATIQWTKKNKVTNEEWAAIKARVSLKGDETLTEIVDKIDETFNSLPSVRERRETEIAKKAKLETMRQFQDNELDFGGGGDTVDYGNNNGTTILNSKESKFLKAFGVTPEEQKSINKEKNTNQWEDGKSPTRKFFEAPKS